MPIHYNSDKTFFLYKYVSNIPLSTKPVINQGEGPTWNLKKKSLLDMLIFISALKYFQFSDGIWKGNKQ